MPVIPVQVINNTLANVSVTMLDATSIQAGANLSIAGVSYNQFINSLGIDVYNPFMIYMYTTNDGQVNTPITFFIFDVNGNKELRVLTPTKDPYQNNNAILYETPRGIVVFNGNSGLTFVVQPLTQITFQFYTVRISNQGDCHAINYLQLEKAENVLFFKEYKCNI
jgi:hypothetical protein